MSKNFKKVWENCLEVIKDNVPTISFRTWFEPIIPIKLEDNILTIQVPSQFFYEYLEENYIEIISKSLKKEVGEDVKLEYSIVMENDNFYGRSKYTVKIPTQNKSDIKNKPVSIKPEDNTIKNPFIIPGIKKLHVDPQLNQDNSFENFIEGECNRLARSAGFAVANNPGGTAFNPLFVYGKSGLGETHLAQAIGIEAKKKSPEKTVLYVNYIDFQTQFIEAVRNNNRNDFIHFYQMIDVLIIDDIHWMSGKEKTQDIFFHIFNHLHQSGKQIIITSDKAPIEMQGIEQRLLSRFKWGLSADLQTPDYQTRMAILKKKTYNDGIELGDDIIEYIASHMTNNIRELEGALISLLAQSTLNKKEITLDLTKQIIDKYVKNTKREISIDYIQKVVCDYFDMDMDQLKSKTRKREIVQARQIAMFFAKSMTKSSLATIGSQIGNKDHATVLHACKTVNNLIDTDKGFRVYIDEIEKKLKL
jgi:chromosomal replication initiator protein